MSFFVWNKYGEYRSNHTAFLYNLGTLVAAHDAYLAEKQKHNYLTGGRYEEYIVNATSPYFMTDTTGEFSPKAIAADMHKNGVLTRLEYKDIVSREGAEISDRDSNAAKYRLTRVEPITVSLAAFCYLFCVHFCKATALLQISRFAFHQKAAKRNSSTCQINNFLVRRSRRTQ